MNSNDKFNIFFIDDIDRLSEEEISILFQIIKNIADFHKVIYVLCYDIDIVASALDVVHRNRGKEYIEKIVQYPIDIPKINKKYLRDHFIRMLDNVVSDDLEGEINYKNDEFYGLYKLGIEKYINSIRDCNRILNAFSMRYYSLKKNVNVSDLLALTVLSLYERSTYVYIAQHANIFMGLSDEGMLSLKLEDADDILKNKIYP
ncbi:MAG: P-loop NTPase fold protein [Selenomonadaceae bacterium]|nr:P-loop NTPase fold protein [Selenomonadaceae bacterium]